MSNLRINGRYFGIAAVALTILLVGCKDDPETIATILVLNEFDEPVTGSEVHLFAGNENADCVTDEDDEGSLFLFDTCATTNASGKVSWNFSKFYKQGQSGFAVLDIRASKGALLGTGIINVEEETTTEETVVLE